MSEYDFSLSLSPTYELTHRMPPHGDTFRVAKQAADLLLDNPENVQETVTQYNGIRLDASNTTPAFRRAIPGTDIASLDIEHTVYPNNESITLYLHDARRAGRLITLTQEDEDQDYPFRDFVISDNRSEEIDFPFNRDTPATAQVISSLKVAEWLEQQIWGQDTIPIRHLGVSELCDSLAQFNQIRRVVTLGSCGLAMSQFHSMKEETFFAKDPGDTARTRLYSCWITADLPGTLLETPHNVTLRARVGFNGDEVADPNNSIKLDIETPAVVDAQRLTEQAILSGKSVLDLLKTAQQYIPTPPR